MICRRFLCKSCWASRLVDSLHWDTANRCKGCHKVAIKKSYSSYSIHLKHLAQAGPDSLKLAIPECCLPASQCIKLDRLQSVLTHTVFVVFVWNWLILYDAAFAFIYGCVPELGLTGSFPSELRRPDPCVHKMQPCALKGGMRSPFLQIPHWNIAAKVVAMSLRIATLLLVSCHHRCCNRQQCLDEPSFMNKK